MAGTKRERELHRQKLARQQKELAEAAARRKRMFQIGGAVAGVVAVIAVIAVVAATTGSSSSDQPAASSTPAVSVAPPNTTGVSCKPLNGKAPLTKTYPKYDGALIEGGKYVENVDTNCGRIVFTMDSVKAPETTKAMSFLSDRQYYDNTVCHRLTTGGNNFVVQCGDPKGTGTGGPGFTVPDENLPAAGGVTYPRGTVAMANAGTGTTGSQFFIVYKDSPFPANYTVLGTVTKGMNIIDYVASKGTADGSADGKPKQPLQIVKMQSAASIEQAAPEPQRTTSSATP